MIYNIVLYASTRGTSPLVLCAVKQSETEDPPLIEVKNLTKQYGNFIAVDGISFKIRNGKIYGLLGPNGAGKSTTMNMIAGSLSPSEGTVTVNGYDIYENPIEAKKQIGYLPDQPPLFPEMTPYEYLCFVAEAKRVPADKVARQVEEVMSLTGVTGMKNRLIKNLSKGYKQRVGIAQTMLGNPDIIILDEPTVGLDPKQITEIRDLIKKLGEKKTVIVSSHILAEISEICDHVIIISRGKVVADDDIAGLESRVSPVRTLSISVKGDKVGVCEVLTQINGVISIADDKQSADKTQGAVHLLVTTESGTDLRDDIFFAMAEKRYAVISMDFKDMSLEKIYLSLTEDSVITPRKKNKAWTPAADRAESAVAFEDKNNNEEDKE